MLWELPLPLSRLGAAALESMREPLIEVIMIRNLQGTEEETHKLLKYSFTASTEMWLTLPKWLNQKLKIYFFPRSSISSLSESNPPALVAVK